MTSFALLPIYLNFDHKDDMNGLPIIAPPAEADEIAALLQELSAPIARHCSWMENSSHYLEACFQRFTN